MPEVAFCQEYYNVDAQPHGGVGVRVGYGDGSGSVARGGLR